WRYSKKFKPSSQEIDAAEFLAAHRGAKIFIRGTGVQGADFLMDGVKWEVKTLVSGTNNAVANNIKKSMKSGNQGSRFIIDGRRCNPPLTLAEAESGIARARRGGAEPTEVMFILGDNSIVMWP
ncbi:hypothetical protein, partial [Andreprevotia sp. IGB-42]|uniref:CdiA C-terminal domain-containing protein n=1 Tax=Andreprevotia sp. IGB-42 TaxID=2497473 RepID=UPI001359E6DE